MAIIKCRECGKEISDKAEVCPNCGCPQNNVNYVETEDKNIVNKNSKHLNKQEPSKNVVQKSDKWYWAISIFIIIILVILYQVSLSNNNDTNNSIISTESTSNSKTENNEQKWSNYYEENQIKPLSVDSELLYEYGEYYIGQYVCTSVIIKEVSNDMLKADTENNTGYFFSLIFKFDDQEEIKSYKEDDYVIIVGQVADDTSIGSTVNINNCHVIGSGENAKNKKEELSQNIDEQKAYAESLKSQVQSQAAEEAAASKQDYINSCKTVNYSDVERNPSNYEGTKIKITGKVIQVSEGWFNSQTLRISVGGNYWYVTYIREDENESRILQDDTITIYGECDGVTSYTSILGNQVTIPSLSAKYIERK